jgi:type I restriction enzyme M protein
MNMLLHGAAGAATIEQGDTLKAPKFLRGTALRTFGLIIANPPFSPKNWGHDWLKKAGDPFGRITHLPPKSHGEIAFVQHMVASLADTGRMAVVLPNGVFFRGGAELALRKDLVDADLVEAVIQLPKDMFFGAGIPACYLVANQAKGPSRAGRVLFVDATSVSTPRTSFAMRTSNASPMRSRSAWPMTDSARRPPPTRSPAAATTSPSAATSRQEARR